MADSYAIISEALAQAEGLLTGERAQAYGDPAEAHAVIASLWTTYLGRSISGQDVALMLALMKIARLKGSPSHEDSMVDALAYLAIGRAHQEHSKEAYEGPAEGSAETTARTTGDSVTAQEMMLTYLDRQQDDGR